jgi:hypothetical protein
MHYFGNEAFKNKSQSSLNIMWTIFMGVVLSVVSCFAIADPLSGKQTIGFGYGATYGGLGFNIGLKSNVDMHYLAFGCIGSTRMYARGPGNSTKESNCGITIGTLREINRLCCYGVNIGQTYNSRYDGDATKNAIHIRFTYLRFFKSLGRGGLNIGMSPVISFGRGLKTRETLMVNLGMQF